MKRQILTILATMALALGASAQDDAARVLARLQSNRISGEYSCVIMQQGVPVSLNGTATVQGDCFHLKGNGLEIFCDGQRLCYVDRSSKEAYIEQAVRLEEYIKAGMGEVKDLKLSKVRYLELSEDMSEFVFETSSLDKSWVVTDLR